LSQHHPASHLLSLSKLHHRTICPSRKILLGLILSSPVSAPLSPLTPFSQGKWPFCFLAWDGTPKSATYDPSTIINPAQHMCHTSVSHVRVQFTRPILTLLSAMRPHEMARSEGGTTHSIRPWRPNARRSKPSFSPMVRK